jgi:hypothetical protein
MSGLPLEASSVLHLIQFKRGGCHIISLITGILGWWMQILNIFKKLKSLMELEEDFRVLLPDKLVHAIIREITLHQEMILLLYLTRFLTNQIVLIKWTIAVVAVILLWGDHCQSQIFHMSSIDVNCNSSIIISTFSNWKQLFLNFRGVNYTNSNNILLYLIL